MHSKRTVHFDLSRRELIICNLFLMRAIAQPTLIGAVIFALFGGVASHNWLTGLWTGLQWAIGFPFLLVSFMSAVTWLNYKKNIDRLTNCEATISEDGFHSASRKIKMEATYGWAVIPKIEEQAGCIMIYISKRPAYAICIPRRCFATPAEADAFLNDALTYWRGAQAQACPHHEIAGSENSDKT